jgi:hypothetical protein
MTHPRPDQTPTLGRIVLVHTESEHGHGVIVPAVVTATPESQRLNHGDPLSDGCLNLVALSTEASWQALGGTNPLRGVPEDAHAEGYYLPIHTKGTWRWPNLR